MAAPASGHGDKRHDPETQDEEIHCLLRAHTGAPSVTIDRVRASASVHVSWDTAACGGLWRALGDLLRRCTVR